MKKTQKKGWGFDTKRINSSLRPQDDFYRYANGGWLKKSIIPATESRWGSFQMLHHKTQAELKGILAELLAAKHLTSGSVEQLVRDMYLSALDLKTREKLGVKPLEPLRDELKKVKNEQELTAYLAKLERLGVSVPWGCGVDQDSKNSEKYVLHFYQSGLGLPDRDYYLKDDTEFKRVRNAYVLHVRKIFRLLGKSKSEALHASMTVMRVETLLAKVSMDKVEARDAEKTYHKKTFAELKKHAPEIGWETYFRLAGIPRVPYVIIAQPYFLKEAARLTRTVPLSDWKIYLEWHLTDGFASLLSRNFVRANFDFYGRVLSGSKKMRPEWRRALGAVNGSLGQALGKIYVKKYFTPEAKRKMDALVDDLFAAYERRIKNLDWMSATTKQKAIKKLKKMGRKIGHPVRWRSYGGLHIKPDDYFGNALRAGEFARRREMRKLKKPIDRHEWHMSPQTVNAYCSFNMNEIVFPAAILQPPFFDLAADDAFNYGAIGAVIGHEMTHGFDDQGAKFDGKGNMNDWWSAADKKRFEKKGALVARQFSAYKIAGGIPVNGKLTLGENIADLGGLVIALDAYHAHMKKTGRKDVGGLTPEQRFFLGAARAACELQRAESQKTSALTDPHSPAEFRVNGPLSNMNEFYQAFDVTKKDKLYRAPKDRAQIW